MKPYYADESVTLWHGDSLSVLRDLPDQSVDCCVTSPPYFGLRDYGVPPTEWPEVTYAPMVGMPPVVVPAMTCALGMEPDPTSFVAHLRVLYAEVRRVLTDDGTLWLNIGDSYYSGRGASTGKDAKNPARRFGVRALDKGGAEWAKPKNLLGIPWRTAFALQDEGWTLRQDNIWSKQNCLPDPAKDRPARSHEYTFLLSKSRTYWYDADAVRQESDRPGKGGRPLRSVWSISAQPFAEAHFAVMPLTMAEWCVQAGCKPGGTVLDPFSGSGTTGLAATKHGRKYVGVDLSSDYLDLSLRTRFAQPGLDLSGGVA